MLKVRKGHLLTCLILSMVISALVISSANAGLFDMFKGKTLDDLDEHIQNSVVDQKPN